jgi:hypothetical protein
MQKWIKKGINSYLEYKSFKTEQRLVIIESDDWGSLRTQDKPTRNKLNAISNSVKNDRYIQLDSIATAEDLQALFEVLNSVKDHKGNPARLTANICTANPDFDAIKACNYTKFHYQDFTKTLSDYSNSTNLFKLWQEGRQHKVFKPQLHGREHLHALAWLAELRAGNKDLLKAFELNTWGIPYVALLDQRRKNLQAALDIYGIDGEANYHKQWIEDSAEIFKKTFGYTANSFIAPAYIWHSHHNAILAKLKIKILQGIKLQYEPKISNKHYNRKLSYIGKTDKKNSLIYAPRNAFFEPNNSPHKDWVSITMQGVEEAFKKNQPVIIGSHRINYIGSLNENNRRDNLAMLKTILKKTVNQYPDVEFISSDQLLDKIQ